MVLTSKVFVECIAREERLVANGVLVLLFRMQEEIGNVIDGLESVVIVVIVVVLLLGTSMMFGGFEKCK